MVKEQPKEFCMRIKSLLLTTAFVASILSPIAVYARPASAVTIDNDPDCDKYAVMWCGGFTMNKIQEKYANGDGHNTANNIQGIFKDLGISKAEVNANGFVTGVVYRNGHVKVGDKVVAKNAKTYIRHLGGKVDVEKMGSAQTAFVKLNKDGQFMYAIMKPCGNPVKAENVVPEPKPTPTPTPTPVQPTPTPVVPTPTPVQPTPTPTPVLPTPTPTPVQAIKCTTLSKIVGNGREVKTEIQASAVNGATIKGYSTNFGDGTVLSGQTATHTYAKDGKFTIVGSVTGLVNGNTVTVSSKECTAAVEFEKNTPVCPTNPSLPADDENCKETTTPETIPATGPEGFMSIFAATTALGTYGHRKWTLRRNKQ